MAVQARVRQLLLALLISGTLALPQEVERARRVPGFLPIVPGIADGLDVALLPDDEVIAADPEDSRKLPERSAGKVLVAVDDGGEEAEGAKLEESDLEDEDEEEAIIDTFDDFEIRLPEKKSKQKTKSGSKRNKSD